MKKPLVYVAGPYTRGDVSRNVQRALQVGDEVYANGGVPIVPHLSHLWDLIDPKPYEHWMELDFDLLESCQALLRFEGDSPGAEREIDHAQELGIPVFYNMPDLLNWILVREVNSE
jgi:hypothetical protein